jgi:hypothetical protein
MCEPGQLGFTFLPDAEGSHPRVVISRPNSDGKVVVVNWTTLNDTCIDDACILHANEHALLHHESTVVYSRARLYDTRRVQFASQHGGIIPVGPVSASVLQRIIQGAKNSPELREEWKQLLP